MFSHCSIVTLDPNAGGTPLVLISSTMHRAYTVAVSSIPLCPHRAAKLSEVSCAVPAHGFSPVVGHAAP